VYCVSLLALRTDAGYHNHRQSTRGWEAASLSVEVSVQPQLTAKHESTPTETQLALPWYLDAQSEDMSSARPGPDTVKLGRSRASRTDTDW